MKQELKRRGNSLTAKLAGVPVIVRGHDSSFQCWFTLTLWWERESEFSWHLERQPWASSWCTLRERGLRMRSTWEGRGDKRWPPPCCERSQGCVHRRLCCLPGEAILELYHDVDLGWRGFSPCHVLTRWCCATQERNFKKCCGFSSLVDFYFSWFLVMSLLLEPEDTPLSPAATQTIINRVIV